MSNTFLTSKPVVCRKPHTCLWCGEGLVAGDRGQYITQVIDGLFLACYLHPECHDASKTINLCNDEGITEHSMHRGSAEPR